MSPSTTARKTAPSSSSGTSTPLDELARGRVLPQAVADLVIANGGIWGDAVIEIDESRDLR
ncbi:MAG TPA: hypothetical protein VHC63_16655 [Acidimicrobiales bacterium]|nr:hypothetical protein [Acidimicrobiales bacterium]